MAPHSFKWNTLIALSVLLGNYCFAEPNLQTTKHSFPFTSELWNLTGNATIEDFQGQKALKLGAKQEGETFSYGLAKLKDTSLENGVIEFDIALSPTQTYAGLHFRIQPNQNLESFYLRAEQSGKPDANQYMPVYHGVPSWQLYYGKAYSAPTNYQFNQWMHIKMVVVDKLADVYIGDMETPAITVRLKQRTLPGALELWSLNREKAVRFANFSIDSSANDRIKGKPAPEAAAIPGAVPIWAVSEAFDGRLLEGKFLLTEELKHTLKSKKRTLKYAQLHAEPGGLTNLAQVQGLEQGLDTVFAKLVITSEQEWIKKLHFGFSDKVKVYLNNQLLFEGDDGELSRDQRFLGTMGYYDTLYLPLKKGKNELLLAVSESVDNAGGWGVQARFEDLQGLTLKTK